MTRFQELVTEGLEQGMPRAAAERRARDILFGDGEAAPAAAPPPPPPPAGSGFASVEELWQSLCVRASDANRPLRASTK